MAAQPHPIAFVDESWLQQRDSPGAYLMAAVIIDQDDVAPAITAANAAAAGHSYHSSELYHRGHVGTIEAMLDVVDEHTGWSVVSAQVPLDNGRQALAPDNPQNMRGHLEDQREYARQMSLERLLRYLNTQRVQDVYLESSASMREWQEARDAGSRLPATDRTDIRAYRIGAVLPCTHRGPAEAGRRRPVQPRPRGLIRADGQLVIWALRASAAQPILGGTAPPKHHRPEARGCPRPSGRASELPASPSQTQSV
ncbi:hypothetical protein ACH4OY_28490 [Micromonospora rubida]|uniref:DUF3800 domain-containing protein n=1 Tax=Micromonospora rubida TaxID=2697657 RepID=A0ABW7SSB4_9ACTN